MLCQLEEPQTSLQDRLRPILKLFSVTIAVHSRPSTTIHDPLRPFTTIYDHPRPSTTTHDPLRPFTTLYDHPRPSTTIHDPLRPFTTIYDHSRPSTTIYDPLRPFTTIYDHLQVLTNRSVNKTRTLQKEKKQAWRKITTQRDVFIVELHIKNTLQVYKVLCIYKRSVHLTCERIHQNHSAISNSLPNIQQVRCARWRRHLK